jgi:hypothetical protein
MDRHNTCSSFVLVETLAIRRNESNESNFTLTSHRQLSAFLSVLYRYVSIPPFSFLASVLLCSARQSGDARAWVELQSLLYASRYVDQSCHERQLRRDYTRGTCFSGFCEQGGSCFVNYSQSQTAIRTLAASNGTRRKSLVVSLETDSLVVESEKKS